MYQKEIKFDRASKDYALFLDGECVGYARTYLEGETTLNALVAELLERDAQTTEQQPAA